MKTLFAALLLAALTGAAQEQQTSEQHMTTAKADASQPLWAAEDPQQIPPPDFIAVEKQPVPILSPAPHYPDSARRSGMEGTVWVKVWVDAQGKAHKAEVIKSENEIFNTPSVDAAMQWTFTPASLHEKPVAVWVTIPFKYKLSRDGAGKPGAVKKELKPVKKPGTK